MNDNKIAIPFAVLAGAVIGYFGASYLKPTANLSCPAKSDCPMLNENQCALRRAMDKLWAEHVLWTRQFLVSAVGKLEDLDAATQRLLKNQEDIGNAVASYYGKQAGAQLTKLLKEHILIAADLVKAAMANDDAKVKELDTKWHANASEIADFLSTANPNWTKDGLTHMLNEHLRLTTLELQDRLKKSWKSDISNYDELFEQARMMGKAIADGIIKQFPQKF